MVAIEAKLGKQSYSIRLTIPQPILAVLGWKSGDTVNIDVEGDRMIVTKKDL